MMPNVTRGDRMSGLLTYLAGPGRSNEHTEPHLVAGDSALMTWHADDELGRDAALRIARHLDRPRAAFGVEVPGGHVWHCSLSLRAEEGEQSDEKWAAIAHDFVKRMGFEDGVKAPVRWAAVRHGVSTAGNDHVHLVVNLVREDGTRASIHNDHRRAQNAARDLEVEHKLETLESVRGQRATVGYDPADREAQARARAAASYERDRRRDGSTAPSWSSLPVNERKALTAAQERADEPREALARTVRGCAGASGDEAEFVRRLRRAGVLVRPRMADGRDDVVTGYSVAAKPVHGERAIWYGGGRLGRDLTLPSLREGWPDTPTGASEAAAEWSAAKRGRRPVARGREASDVDGETWRRCREELRVAHERLSTIDPGDVHAWGQAARETSGVFAAWSMRVEQTPGPIARASDALGKAAQVRPLQPPRRPTARISLVSTALVLQAASSDNAKARTAVLVRELVRLSASLYKAAKAREEARLATSLRDRVRLDLEGRIASMEAVGTSRATSTPDVAQPAPALPAELAAIRDRAQAGQSAPTPSGSPIPNKLDPQPRIRQTTTPDRDRGPGR